MNFWYLPIVLLALAAPPSSPRLTQIVPAPPAVDYSPSRWMPYQSVEGRFRARFPEAPSERESRLDTPTGQVTLHTVTFRSFILYSVTYADFPRDVENANELQDAFSAMRASTLEAVKEQSPRVVDEREIRLGGHPGRAIRIDLEDSAVIRMRWYAAGSRMYAISVIVPKKHDGTTGAEGDYETIASAFLDSFEIVKEADSERAFVRGEAP